MLKPILSLTVLILSLGFSFFYVKPEYEEMQNRRDDLKMINDTLKDAEIVQTLINQTSEILAGIPPQDLASFDTFLPVTIDEIRLANNIQRIGIAKGVILSGIKVSAEHKDAKAGAPPAVAGGVMDASVDVQKKYATTKVSFTFVAPYTTFLLFLDDLEKSLGIINITMLSFFQVNKESEASGVQNPKGPPEYGFNVEIETYSLK